MNDDHIERRPIYLPGIDLTLWVLIVFLLLAGAAIVTGSLILIIR
ncbi:MAG: hypothetical protein QOG53_290 [Frankiales bacterium]|nr:hypothetical protein [Frankiales bacterium]